MPENNNTYDMPFPTRLRLLLDETGISQQELADYVGVKRQTIAQWKDGKTVPDINNFQKVAQYFSVPYEYLLGDTDSRIRENFYLESALGLSDGAIKALMLFLDKKEDEDVPTSKLVSYILESESFATTISHFRNFIHESALQQLRRYYHENDKKNIDQLNSAAKLLLGAGIAVMDADSMKSYHLEQAKSAFGKAIEGIEEKMRDEISQGTKAYFDEHGEQDFNAWIQEKLKEVAEKWQQS